MVIQTNLKCELQKAVRVQYLNGNLFSQDNQGNKINVEVFDGGSPATLSGTVSANVIRADGGTVAVSSGSFSGNVASVVLPAAAYAVPGVVSIIIKITSSGVITTLAAVVANVYQSSTDSAVDPGTIIPSIQTLISSIETAVASIPADYSSLWTSLAPAFNSSNNYTAGQYVTYDGSVYMFNANHSGSWSASDVISVDIGGQLSQLKNAVSLVVDYDTYAPNYSNFASAAVRGAVRLSGITNGDKIGEIKSITLKTYVESARTGTLVLAQRYQDSNLVWKYKVYATISVSLPATSIGEIITLVNGTDFDYQDEVLPNSYIGIDTSNVSVYYYADGYYSVSFASPTSVGSEYREADVKASYNIGLGFNLLNNKFAKLEARVDVLEHPKEIYSYVPDIGDMATSAASAFRFSGVCTQKEGKIKSISLKASANGTAYVYLSVPNMEKMEIIGTFSFAVKQGVNEYFNGVDFTYIDTVPRLCYVGIVADDFLLYYKADGTNHFSKYISPIPDSISVGDKFSYYVATYNISVGITIEETKEEADTHEIKMLQLKQPNRTAILKSGVMHFADTDLIAFEFVAESVSGKINILRSGTGNIANGNGAFVDLTNSKIGFYKGIATTSDTLVIAGEQAMTLSIVTGRKYGVKYSKNLNDYTITVTDSVTFSEDQYIISDDGLIGAGHGYAVHTEPSNISISNFIHLSYQKATPKTLILGDSWTDGNTTAGHHEDRFCSLYSSAINDDTYICAMGGGRAIDGIQWIANLVDVISPSYVLLEFGVNEGSLDFYKQNMSEMIAFVKNEMNAIPVLVKIPPTLAASSSIYSSINQFVENSGEKYIDMCTPMTVNGDGTTLNENLFFADKIHPNFSGHLAIYKEMQIDVPELFIS